MGVKLGEQGVVGQKGVVWCEYRRYVRSAMAGAWNDRLSLVLAGCLRGLRGRWCLIKRGGGKKKGECDPGLGNHLSEWKGDSVRNSRAKIQVPSDGEE